MSAFIWIAIGLICFIIEVATVGFWVMWFGISAIIVSFCSLFGIESLEIQLLIFSLIGLILVFLTRPILLRCIKSKEIKSNTDALIGKHGIVISDISPLAYGEVKVGGDIWTATSKNTIPAQSEVEIIAISGVKLEVIPVNIL